MTACVDTAYYRTDEFKKRMDRMFVRDCIFACAFLTVLWVTYLFVYFTITVIPQIGSGIRIVLTVAGLAVCIYNTCSVTAMLRHNFQNKEFKYTVDLRHLDAMRAAKRSAAQGAETL